MDEMNRKVEDMDLKDAAGGVELTLGGFYKYCRSMDGDRDLSYFEIGATYVNPYNGEKWVITDKEFYECEQAWYYEVALYIDGKHITNHCMFAYEMVYQNNMIFDRSNILKKISG